MKVEQFVNRIKKMGITNMVGVPDSTLKEFCSYMNSEENQELKHYVPANEGAAVGMAAGIYLATGKPACVYMQNSGLGNTVNPITSLMNQEVYDIPMLMLIGWRGEPGIHDEPQHKFMGKITGTLLSVMEIPYAVISERTTEDELNQIFEEAHRFMSGKKQYAIVIKKNTFEPREGRKYANSYKFVREDALGIILQSVQKDDLLVSTTGKISREVYEQSDRVLGQHAQAFLTVGGMGHASMIALGMAENSPNKRVYCIDGDGAVLMHMGNLPFIGKRTPKNLVHICLNNDAHESVGGMPTGATGQSYAKIAKESGYQYAVCVDNKEHLLEELRKIKELIGPIFIEIKVSMDSRENLGRPKETAIENKESFMKYHEVI